MRGNRRVTIIAVLCCLAAAACAQDEQSVLIRVGGSASEATVRYEGPDGFESVTDQPPFRVRVDVGSSFSLDAEVSNDSLDGDVSCEIETDDVPAFGISSSGTAMCSITMRSSGGDRSVETSTDAIEADGVDVSAVVEEEPATAPVSPDVPVGPVEGAEMVKDRAGDIGAVLVDDGQVLIDTSSGMYLLDATDLTAVAQTYTGPVEATDLRGGTVLSASLGDGSLVEWSFTASDTTFESRRIVEGLEVVTGASWVGEEVWVSTDDSLTRVDPITGDLLGRIDGPDVVGPTIGDVVVTSTQGFRVIHLVDPGTGEYRTIEFAGPNDATGMAAVDGRLWVWFADEPVQVITPTAPDPTVTLDLDGVDSLGVDDDGSVYGEVWGDLCRLDPVTGNPVSCLQSAASAELVAVGAGALWLTDGGGSSVWRLPVTSFD